MSDEIQTPADAGTLAPVQSGEGAFKETAQEGMSRPEVSQEESTLQQILAAVREGKDAGKIIDESKATDTTAQDPAETDKDKPAPAAVKPTGNKALDIAVQSFVKVAGATEDDISQALTAAYESGDVRLIDRAFLKERFGEHSDQAIALAEAVMEHEVAASQQLLKEVHSLAGGEEQFGKAVEIFKEHAPKGMQGVIKQMLDSNDADTVKEAASLIVEYGKQSGVMVQGDKRLIGDAGLAKSNGLSYDEFTAAYNKLNPTSRSYQADVGRLMELRRIGKQLGK